MLLLAALPLLSLGALSAHDTFLMRGIPVGLPEPIQDGGARLGINVELERYNDDDIEGTLSAITELGIAYVKQPFYHSENYQWETADRLVSATHAQGLSLVPLLDGDPIDGFTPPEDFALYADWAGEFARRYGDSISHYIIWDEPNLTSHWGGQPVNPNHYAALLTAAAERVLANDPDAVIVAAPLAPTGSLARERQANVLTGAAPFYRCYKCADERYIAIGALELQFYAAFLGAMEVESYARFAQRDPSFWPELSSLLEQKFASRPLDHWLVLLTPLDACISPVLTVEESLVHPHARARDMFVEIAGVRHPAPAPRFSRTAGAIQGAAGEPGEGGLESLRRWGVT